MPQLEFDSSGTAVIRFFGKISKVKIHYASAKISMQRMVCPADVRGLGCLVCEHEKAPLTERMIVVGWDCHKKDWCSYMASLPTFSEIFRQAKEAGVSSSQMEAGEGPDVYLQRIGAKTDVIIATETIGHPRGSPEDVWQTDKIKNGKIVEPKQFPDVDEVVIQISRNSAWRQYPSLAGLEAAYPKNGVVPTSQPNAIAFGQQNIVYGGGNNWIGGMGFTGVQGYSGVAGAIGVQGQQVPIASGTVSTVNFWPTAPVPNADIPQKAFEPPVIKIAPKKKDGEDPPKMPTAEDRWDFLR